MTNMTDGSYENPSSTNHDAARAWLDRCSPEYRAELEEALHDDVCNVCDGTGFDSVIGEVCGYCEDTHSDGFLDSWQETREQTKAAVDAFVARRLTDEEVADFKRQSEENEWVDPCPSWDDIRPHGVTAGSPRDERMRARYEAGRLEYREDWTKWEVARFTDMIREEEDDSTIYRAMRQWVMRQRGLL